MITTCDDSAGADHIRGESGHDVGIAVLNIGVGVRVCCHLKLTVAGRGRRLLHGFYKPAWVAGRVYKGTCTGMLR